MKIGIITHYYKSPNYGGNLQAYALTSVLRKLGYQAEQISYKREADSLFLELLVPSIQEESHLVRTLKEAIKDIVFFKIWQRKRCINRFNSEQIPHSTKVYTKNDLATLGADYDVFITGSDQVWHPYAVCDAYLLNFPTHAKKISYAASFAIDELDKRVHEYYARCLGDFDAISVREKTGLDIVHLLTGKQAQWVLDPTLLLSRSEWDIIAEKAPVEAPYVLCFFLGDASTHRDVAKAFAQLHDLEIVTLPDLNGRISVDSGFGDRRLYQVSPGQLISLIKNAQYIITDSFHITVFSILFEKQFYVFPRGTMGSRIQTLMDIFDLNDRFCYHADLLEQMKACSPIDYTAVNKELFENLKEQSLAFLKNNLGNVEQS